jgi:hypothetical protein
MQDVAARVLAALDKAAVLTPAQYHRLWQLVWQNCGPAALIEPAVRQALQLTEAQRKQIEGIRERTLEALRGVRQEGREEPAENHAPLRRQALDEALVLLTPEQKSRWEELKGPPAGFRLEGTVSPPLDELG